MFGSSVNSNLREPEKEVALSTGGLKNSPISVSDLKSRRLISTQLASINALIFLSKAVFIVKWNKIGTKIEKISKTMKL